jgi:hypothetical protein
MALVGLVVAAQAVAGVPASTIAQAGPEVPVLGLFSAIEEKRFDDVPSYFCPAYAGDAADLDLAASLTGSMPEGIDPQAVLDALSFEVTGLSGTGEPVISILSEEPDGRIVLGVEALVRAGIDPETSGPFVRSLVEVTLAEQGMEANAELVDAMMTIVEAQLDEQFQTSEAINKVIWVSADDRGGWLICSSLGDGYGPLNPPPAPPTASAAPAAPSSPSPAATSEPLVSPSISTSVSDGPASGVLALLAAVEEERLADVEAAFCPEYAWSAKQFTQAGNLPEGMDIQVLLDAFTSEVTGLDGTGEPRLEVLSEEGDRASVAIEARITLVPDPAGYPAFLRPILESQLAARGMELPEEQLEQAIEESMATFAAENYEEVVDELAMSRDASGAWLVCSNFGSYDDVG